MKECHDEESTTPIDIATTIQVGGRLVRSEPLDSPLVVDACATPPPPVLAALNVPDGAGLDVAVQR
jgi:hypothetical protein